MHCVMRQVVGKFSLAANTFSAVVSSVAQTTARLSVYGGTVALMRKNGPSSNVGSLLLMLSVCSPLSYDVVRYRFDSDS